jgi:cyclohexadieny/prephenate dehydrogenase
MAIDASAPVIKRVKELGIADKTSRVASKAVMDADFIILCVPVGICGSIAESISGSLKPGAIVTDVGSVKGAVIKAVQPHLPAGVHLVPGHPVAGTEYSGPDAGFSSLFDNRWCILTPPAKTDKKAIAKVRAFWEAAGSKVEIMNAEHHDLVLAVTSHVPHLIAYNIVGTADDLAMVTQSEVIKFSAGGFRDFTRIAASDPTMWRDVFLHNKEAVLEILGRFQEDLFYLQRAIRWDEGEKLFELFSRTRDIRRGIINQGQETAEPDFGRNKKS